LTTAPVTPGVDQLALATRGLRKAYGGRLAVGGLDLSVPRGVVYGFLGPNGAGKTTTMRMLTGLIKPDSGDIYILGRPFTRGDRERLYTLGALVENAGFYPFLSARQNLSSFAATGRGPSPKRIDELLDLVGLADRSNDPVGDFSLGMKQRLGIATALLNDPELLLLDEPSNGLDPAGIVAMRELLRRLAASGKTVFVSSHILGEVRMMVDVVGIIAAGRLVREGPINDLLAAEALMRVRVHTDEADRAASALTSLGGPASVAPVAEEPGWFTVRMHPDRGDDVAKALVGAGIYPMALESGSELEELFLRLTQEANERTGPGFAPAGVPVEAGDQGTAAT
jgi:ABC-2 type transport system ATP-binding protein